MQLSQVPVINCDTNREEHEESLMGGSRWRSSGTVVAIRVQREIIYCRYRNLSNRIVIEKKIVKWKAIV